MGGRGSGKSWFASQKCILRCFRQPGHRIAVFRKIARTLRQSVYQRILDQLSFWKLLPFCKVNKTDMTITFPNGSQIIFLGLDESEKIKSLEGVTSVWLEEMTEFSEQDLEDIDMIIRGECGSYKQVIGTLNPKTSLHWIKKRFFDGRASDATTHVSTYLDNDYRDRNLDKQMADLRKRNPALAAVYADAEWGILEGLIYQPPRMELDYPDAFDDEVYGLDFGFNNPTALVWIGGKDIQPGGDLGKGDVYLRESIYQSELTTPQLAMKMRELKVDKRARIYADSAQPGMIQELKSAGFNVLPADKGPGSVEAGIKFVQGLTIHTLPENSNLNSEFQTYSWEVDKNGNALDKPTKFFDHLMDAMRYGVATHWKRKRIPAGTRINRPANV